MASIIVEFPTSATAAEFYQSVATPEGIAAWWCKDCDIGNGGVGARHELRFTKNGETVTMQFRVDIDEESNVKWTCLHNDNPIWEGTDIDWEFTGGEVSLAHEGFEDLDDERVQAIKDGWDFFAASMQRHLNGGNGSPM